MNSLDDNLYLLLEDKMAQLETCVKQLRKNGSNYAQAEYEYKIAINKKALELKDEGMPITLIQLVIYGYDDIANLRFKRDVAEKVYDANKEAINSIKLELRIIEEQIKREWAMEMPN